MSYTKAFIAAQTPAPKGVRQRRKNIACILRSGSPFRELVGWGSILNQIQP